MRDFFKMMVASAAGYFIAIAAASFMFVMSVSFLAALGGGGGASPVSLKENSILRINLMGQIVERDSQFDFNFPGPLGGDFEPTIGLYDVKAAIEHAANDGNIKGIYLRFYGPSGSYASFESLRRSLEKFKESGKFIYAYSEFYGEADSYLAAVADKIVMYPQGFLESNGFASIPVFFKKTLAKLEIKPTIFRVGEFKSAVEPFVRESMSEENRLQTKELLDDLWNHYALKVSEKRDFMVADVNNWANKLSVIRAKDALDKKLVTELSTETTVLQELMQKTELKDEKKPRFIGYKGYLNASGALKKFAMDKIAVLMVEGDIVYGDSDEDSTGSETFVKQVREIAQDDSVKGLIVRVNSPGGDALASDVMHEELMHLKKKIPVYTSFSDVAASGGYYLAAGSTKILAENTTITGSIGVFGLMFNTKDFFDSKLGMQFDRVVTNPYADNMNSNRDLTDLEKRKVQDVIESIYDRFLSLVKDGRKFESLDAVKKIAGGRVWSGRKALELGLVDELGGLDTAVEMMTSELNIKDFKVQFYPGEKGPLEALLKKFGASLSDILESRFGLYSHTGVDVKTIEKVKSFEGIQARMPFEFKFQ